MYVSRYCVIQGKNLDSFFLCKQMQFYNGFDFSPNPASKLKAIFFFMKFPMYCWLGCFSIWTIDGAAIAFCVKLTTSAFSHQMNWRLGT